MELCAEDAASAGVEIPGALAAALRERLAKYGDAACIWTSLDAGLN